MLVSALLLLTLTLGAAYFAFRKKAHRSAPSTQPVYSEYLPTFHRADPLPPPPRALEVAHASRSGALALTAGSKARVRPGHRCVDEVRRRCHVDFVGALNFLEGQLNRKVSNDPLEQARYWIDLAEGLRGLNLHESLPALLRRADDALDMPLAEGYAAEVASFAAFAEFLHDPLTPEGQSALRIVRVAMEGVRRGKVPATVYADAAFGDAVRRLSENCPDAVNPRLVWRSSKAFATPAGRSTPTRRSATIRCGGRPFAGSTRSCATPNRSCASTCTTSAAS